MHIRDIFLSFRNTNVWNQFQVICDQIFSLSRTPSSDQKGSNKEELVVWGSPPGSIRIFRTWDWHIIAFSSKTAFLLSFDAIFWASATKKASQYFFCVMAAKNNKQHKGACAIEMLSSFGHLSSCVHTEVSCFVIQTVISTQPFVDTKDPFSSMFPDKQRLFWCYLRTSPGVSHCADRSTFLFCFYKFSNYLKLHQSK